MILRIYISFSNRGVMSVYEEKQRRNNKALKLNGKKKKKILVRNVNKKK